MTIEEIQGKLESLLKKIQASGCDSLDDSLISELESCAAPAGDQGMMTCKQLIENFVKVLKTRKAGETGDENVAVRFTALDFYVKKLQSGSTEDL